MDKQDERRYEDVLAIVASLGAISDPQVAARTICDLWAAELVEARDKARQEARRRAYGVARERLRKLFQRLEDEMLAMEAHPGRHGGNKRQEIALKSHHQAGVTMAIFELDDLCGDERATHYRLTEGAACGIEEPGRCAPDPDDVTCEGCRHWLEEQDRQLDKLVNPS